MPLGLTFEVEKQEEGFIPASAVPWVGRADGRKAVDAVDPASPGDSLRPHVPLSLTLGSDDFPTQMLSFLAGLFFWPQGYYG